jgi:hypothetical protein
MYLKSIILKRIIIGLISIALIGLIIVSIFHDSHASTHSISYGFALNFTPTIEGQPARIDELRKIKSEGFEEVRLELDWNIIQQKNSTTYDWAAFDEIMTDVKESGLKSIVTLNRTPPWARSVSCKASYSCAPVQPSYFAKFAAAAVERYQRYNVSAWEIWNEPNIVNFWQPAPNPGQYTKLLSDAYVAIKQQDPDAVVLVGGLTGSATDDEGSSYMDARTFLNDLYADNAKNYFDGVAYHPYTSLELPNVASPTNGWYKMSYSTPSIRSIMVANGDKNKDVWITEFGAPTNGPGAVATNLNSNNLPANVDHVTPMEQAQIAQAALNSLKSDNWIEDLDWYTYMDSGTDTSSTGDFYGLVDFYGNFKPSYYSAEKALKISNNN